MTERVIDALEIVHIQHDQRMGDGMDLGIQAVLRQLLKGEFVENTGKLVVVCLNIERGDKALHRTGQLNREDHTDDNRQHRGYQRRQLDQQARFLQLAEDDIRGNRAYHIPVLTAGIDRHEIIIIEDRGIVLVLDAADKICRKRLSDLIIVHRGVENIVILVQEPDGHVVHGFRVIKHILELISVERNNEQRIFVDALDVVDALEIVMEACRPAVMGALARDDGLHVGENGIPELIDRAVGHFSDNVIVPVHDKVIHEVVHDAQTEQLVGDCLFHGDSLVFVIARVGRVVGIGFLRCKGKRCNGLHALQVAVQIQLHLHIQGGNQTACLRFQHPVGCPQGKRCHQHDRENNNSCITEY